MGSRFIDSLINPSKQQPTRMHVDKSVVDLEDPSHQLTEADFDALLVPPEMRAKYLADRAKETDNLRGLRLVNKHRYGDDVDILRATFTKTKDEIEQEKFKLILACRALLRQIFWCLKKVPKHEKYVLGGDIRQSAYTILRHSVGIKKRYYRKNLLESIDIELELLREYLRLAHSQYPDWMDEQVYDACWTAVNEVGAIVGGLMKTTVA